MHECQLSLRVFFTVSSLSVEMDALVTCVASQLIWTESLVEKHCHNNQSYITNTVMFVIHLLFSDLLFSEPFQLHQERMQQMMGGFSDPFGQGFMPSITDGRHRGHRAMAQPNTDPNDCSSRVSVSNASCLLFSQTVLLCNLIERLNTNTVYPRLDDYHSITGLSPITHAFHTSSSLAQFPSKQGSRRTLGSWVTVGRVIAQWTAPYQALY